MKIKKRTQYRSLDISNTEAKAIGKIANDIDKLNCKNNKLRTLPALPRNLIYLDARYNDFSHARKKRIIRECYRKNILLKI